LEELGLGEVIRSGLDWEAFSTWRIKAEFLDKYFTSGTELDDTNLYFVELAVSHNQHGIQFGIN
jgi:hypothetical protein